jgi:hypothetical protein
VAKSRPVLTGVVGLVAVHRGEYTQTFRYILGSDKHMEEPAYAASKRDSEVDELRHELAAISGELRAGMLLPATFASSTHGHFAAALREALERAPKAAWPRLAVSFNDDQVESKLWLLEHLPAMGDLAGKRVVILGAWFGLLAMLLERLAPHPPRDVICVDVDDAVCELASKLLSVLQNTASVLRADMLDLDYVALSSGQPTIFVNTSCEHLADFRGWRSRVPRHARVVLQSNNHVGCSEHVNCVPDLAAFERQVGLSEVVYRGTLRLRHFTRFMLMGTA